MRQQLLVQHCSTIHSFLLEATWLRLQEDHEPAQKKSGLTKGTKALKHW